MAARQYYYTAVDAEASTVTTGYADIVSLTFTPDANSAYLFIWNNQIANRTNITSDWKARFFDDTGATTLGEQNVENKDNTAVTGDYAIAYGIAQMSFGAAPSPQTVSIEFAAETSTNTIVAKNSRIVAIKLDAADQYTSTEGTVLHSTTTYTAAVALTFTPATQGDYLILHSTEGLDGTAGGGTWRLLAADGATEWGHCRQDPKDATNWRAFGSMHRATLTAVSQTISGQINAVFASNVSARRSRIAALRLDNFDQNIYAEDNTRTTVATVTYVTKCSITSTPAAETYLVIGSGIIDSNLATASNYWEANDGAQIFESYEEITGGNGTNGSQVANLGFTVKSYAATPTTFAMRARSELNTLTTGHGQAAIIAVQLTVTSGSASATADPAIHYSLSLMGCGL